MVGSLLQSRAPSLQARHLVQHLVQVHQRLESGQLGGDVIHGGYELRLELGGLLRCQSEAAHELVKNIGGTVVDWLLMPIVVFLLESISQEQQKGVESEGE